MNIYQKSAVATAGTALSLLVMEASPAPAAILTYDFTLKGSNNFGSGSLTYDTLQGQDPSFPPLAVTPKLTDFNVSYLGKTYTDVQFVNRLTVVSSIKTNPDTGELVSDRLVVPFPGCGVTCQPALVIENQSFLAISDPFGSPTDGGAVTYSLRTPSTSVPEPDFTTLGLSALGCGWLLKKKMER
jgi:hypothetical protein